MSAKLSKGLGKGLDALVPTGFDVSGVSAGANERVHRLAIDTVKPKKDQPRTYFNEDELAELAQSISEHGIFQPLIVTQVEQDNYSIIAGERRWRAAKIAGLTEVPAIIRSATEHEQLELALLENIQRADLSSLEMAITIHRLNTQFGQKHEDIAKRLGKGHSTVVNLVRLLGLPQEMQESLRVGTITEGHARALLSLAKYPEAQKALFASIVSKQWSVRQAEQFVVNVKKGAESTDEKKQKSVHNELEDTAKKIKTSLGIKNVALQQSAKGSGKLVIGFKNDKELDKVISRLLG